jgi:hypothetical protein
LALDKFEQNQSQDEAQKFNSWSIKRHPKQLIKTFPTVF